MRALFAHTQGGVDLEEALQHALSAMGGEEDPYGDPLDEEGVAFARRLLLRALRPTRRRWTAS
jgi:N utilization substance protein B